MVLKGRALIGGEAQGPLLQVRAPISFWGGVDPASGLLSDPRHPDHGRSIAGTVLALHALQGSSSSSAVMLELMARGLAPAALLLAETDAILVLGVVVAREMGYRTIPVLELPKEAIAALPEGRFRIRNDSLERIAEI